MTLNCNLMFEEKNLYTYAELLAHYNEIDEKDIFNEDNQWGDVSDFVVNFLIPLRFVSGYGSPLKVSNGFGYSFVKDGEEVSDCVPLLVVQLFNKILARYGNHYCCVVHKELKDYADYVYELKNFARKILNLVDYTYEKYATLLNLYKSKENNMLDKLGRTRSGSREISSEGETSDNTINLFNDTPQTTDVVATIEGNQYVSELNKGSNQGTSSSSGTDEFSEEEEFDTKTIMEKLDEIQRNYAQLWKSWLDEFDQLFIEEVNF